MTAETDANDTLLRKVVDASPLGAYIQVGGKFVYSNNHFRRSVSGEGIVGNDWFNMVHADDVADVKRCAIEMLKGERSLPYEFRLLGTGGDIRWIVETVASVQYEGQRAVLGNFIDITEEKQTEERLNLLQTITTQISEARDANSALANALNSICQFAGWSVGEAWVVNGNVIDHVASSRSKDERILRFNAASRLANVTIGEGVVGSVWAAREPLFIEDLSQHESFARKAAAAEAGFKSGVAFPVVVANEVIAVLLFFISETKREDHRLQALIGALAMQLGSVISQKQVQDALRNNEQQLRSIAADLELKNADLEAFTYSISHDLKEPLRALEGFSQYLISNYSEALDQRGKDLLQRITNASLRMKRLIDDLLSLSRAARGVVPDQAISLEDALGEVLEAMAPRIQERNATVEVSPLPPVIADRPRLEQILQNLVSNGLKFNLSEEPRVEIGVRDQDESKVTFYVKDNGIGIDSQYHDKIFGLFQRLHTQDEFEGNGAGLAIVKRAIEAMGGNLSLESAAGEGTTFFVTLPLAPAPEAKESETPAAVAA